MDANRLRFVELFDDFSDRELELLAGIMNAQRFPAGRVVFSKGQRATACYVVISGGVVVIVEG